MWLFDDFAPGLELGTWIERVEPAMLQQLRAVYGSKIDDAPLTIPESAALTMVMMMRAYLSVVAPRPDGNIHARQRFRLEAVTSLGEEVQTRITCFNKEIKRERRYLDIGVVGTGSGSRPLFKGTISLIWAA